MQSGTQPGCRSSRLHDFRHSLSVGTLIDAHCKGCDVDERVAVLATRLGHVIPSRFYWCLTVTPTLVGAASERGPVLPGGNLPVTALAPAVESSFTGCLIARRGASPRTIASYRDAFRLLFAWIREQTGARPSGLDFADAGAATVTSFPAMLKDERHNTSRTRSQRLTAVHFLFRHAALGIPSTPRSSPRS